MIRSKDYLKSKFEDGDIPTGADYSDFIDSCYNDDSGTTNMNISLPTVNFFVREYISGEKSRTSGELYSYWSQSDLAFLDYNPKLWLFRYKNNRKDFDGGITIKHKKDVHTPHLNGVNYPNSSFYSGSFFSDVPEINATGVHTEFDIPIVANETFKVDIDPYDWFYMYSAKDSYKLNDSLPLTSPEHYLRVMGRPKGNHSFLFRLAITIDNPNGEQQRIIGPMSDIIALRIQNGYFEYQRRFSDLSTKRFNM